MSGRSVAIRTLSLAEIGTLVDWAAEEGWNPGLHDAVAFQAADPQGFLGAFVKDQMVAGISSVDYGGFGFIGLYICRADMRGQGYGRAVWDAGMARLANATVGLDGVPAQQSNYRSMGFVPAYRTYRFSGRLDAKGSPSGLGEVEPHLLPALGEFDRRFFPAARPAFLERWVARPHIALVQVGAAGIQGYGVARECREGFKIGPLFALDETTATNLLAALCARCPGEVHIDVPEGQGEFADRLLKAGFSRGFETARMYRGPAPDVDGAGIFGVSTLELG
ncbi:GNAT family N-acetyltransferase [Mesorhizobium sp. KR9-304]|uniref:GNAT family N-acetyltransferase n=1 Tax=Mesorhizobium sp. KR9-304 TaxID=3156614 RepID=UPI0032B466EE